MSLENFTALIDSHARRYIKHMPLEYRELLSKAKRLGTAKAVKTHIREAVIVPQWVGLTFQVHGGKEFKQFIIQQEMLGRRLGDFVHTTGRVLHSGPGVGATRGSKFLPLK